MNLRIFGNQPLAVQVSGALDGRAERLGLAGDADLAGTELGDRQHIRLDTADTDPAGSCQSKIEAHRSSLVDEEAARTSQRGGADGMGADFDFDGAASLAGIAAPGRAVRADTQGSSLHVQRHPLDRGIAAHGASGAWPPGRQRDFVGAFDLHPVEIGDGVSPFGRSERRGG
jgi:hypothetical protein